MSFFTLEMSGKQKDRIVDALLEYAVAHPEIPDDDFISFDTDHPLSLAEMIKDAMEDGTTGLCL